jgi:hypothetical protein
VHVLEVLGDEESQVAIETQRAALGIARRRPCRARASSRKAAMLSRCSPCSSAMRLLPAGWRASIAVWTNSFSWRRWSVQRSSSSSSWASAASRSAASATSIRPMRNSVSLMKLRSALWIAA